MIRRQRLLCGSALPAVLALQVGCIAVFGVRESEWSSDDGPRHSFVASSSQPDETEAVRRVLKSLARADSSGDAEGASRLYTADAAWFPPDRQPVVGREAIRDSYDRQFAGQEMKVDIYADEIEVSDGMAYARGTSQVTQSSGAVSTSRSDSFLMILQRDSEGLWKIHRLMWFAAPASTQP